jgi:nucleoside 2-deoxyribosyltransferase
VSYQEGWDSAEMAEWKRAQLVGMIPQLKASGIAISIAPPDRNDIDLQYCVELGATIALGKPLLVIAREDYDVSEKLLGVADEVVYLKGDPTNPENRDELVDAIRRMRERFS